MQGIMPPTLPAIIASAADLDETAYARLEELVKQPTSTDPSDPDVARVAGEVGMVEDDLRYLLSFISFLFEQTSSTPVDELVPTLTAFISENSEISEPVALAEKLNRLLAHREVHLKAAKKARLTNGFLPNLLGLANFVDVRNDFERDSNGELTGKLLTPVPVIQILLRTNSPRPDERQIVLQLDEKSLDQIDKAIVEIRQKLAILGIS